MKTGIPIAFIHFFALVFFVLAALIYFHPVLQGKVIYQSDIAQYNGMAREQQQFREQQGEEPFWTNSAFGGMPTYQLGANYPHDYVKKLDRVLRFLPRPADYLFLYFLGFYILMCCLKTDYRLAILGALAFGFSTYLLIILGVGHNAKAHALAYLPIILGGIILVFREKYVFGFMLTSIGMALEVSANHYQMTYYFMLLVLILGTVYFIDSIRHKTLREFFTACGILLLAVLLGIGANATPLMATKEYADWSTRGPSELSITPEGGERQNTAGLSKEYITQYSYGVPETLNIFVPGLFGGSNGEDLGPESRAYDYLIEQGLPRTQALEFASSLPLYWGKQPGVAGPAYLGAVVCLLFLLGLFLIKGKTKWWLLGGALMAILLSWGKNFGLLTNFMIDYFPLYDKFRAVSSIQVILELCAPILGILALKKFMDPATAPRERQMAVVYSAGILIALALALLLLRGTFSFSGLSDPTYEQYFGKEVLNMIKQDRQALYTSDTIRSLVYVLLGGLALWLFHKGRIGRTWLIPVLGILILADLVGVGLRYVNEDDFVRPRLMEKPFQQTGADELIRKDSTIFRVYDPQEGLNGARTSYFHQSIGGYHAAKPAGIQDLFDFHIYKNNLRVLNMLNVKYVLQQEEGGQPYPALNQGALGNAWFVSGLLKAGSANEEIQALDSLDPAQTAVFDASRFPDISKLEYAKDSTSRIRLEQYEPNYLSYRASSPGTALAVFSEIYYPHGWQAYLDGKPVPHFRVNYSLRAMQVPAGNHRIEFKFEPEIVATGSTISLISSILLGLILLSGIFYALWRKPAKSS